MGRNKKRNQADKPDQMDNLKWETAKELELDEDLAQSGDELSVVEAGRIGGNMTRKLVDAGQKALEEEDDETLPVSDQDL